MRTFPHPKETPLAHLHRRPRGAWTGLDTTVAFGPSGRGLTSTVLHDVDGPAGQAQQILTVRPIG